MGTKSWGLVCSLHPYFLNALRGLANMVRNVWVLLPICMSGPTHISMTSLFCPFNHVLITYECHLPQPK